MNHYFQKKTPSILFSVTIASAVLIGCGPGSIDSKEKALEQLSQTIEKDVSYSQRENTYRANIQLTQTNLLSILPSIDEYPVGCWL